jgi:hypothetical protein
MVGWHRKYASILVRKHSSLGSTDQFKNIAVMRTAATHALE